MKKRQIPLLFGLVGCIAFGYWGTRNQVDSYWGEAGSLLEKEFHTLEGS